MRLSHQGKRFTLNMAVGHRDFFRTLPAAMGDLPYTVSGGEISAGADGRRLTISLGPEQRRQIGLLQVLNTDVSFAFEDFAQDAIDTFMQHFLARYQRGGG